MLSVDLFRVDLPHPNDCNDADSSRAPNSASGQRETSISFSFKKFGMNELRFDIVPSPRTNDHEVKIFVDGAFLFDGSQMGLDPSTFFKQVGACHAGPLLVGRCECGCIGCDDFFANVSREAELVAWHLPDGRCYKFEKQEYESVVSALLNDNSWEDLNRRVERLLSELFDGTEIEEGLSFSWASARIKKGMIHLSYSGALGQQLIDFNCDGETEDSALRRARAYLRERFDDYP